MKLPGNLCYRERLGVGYLRFSNWEAFPGICHAFSTRIGGVSQAEFSSLNLAFHRGDPDENVRENYRRLCAAAGFSYEKLVSSAQTHQTTIRRVGLRDSGAGIWRAQDMPAVDGLCTNEPGVTLVTHYADCVPLFFYDPLQKCVGLAHAGWRGTVGRIGEKMVKTLCAEFGSDPADLWVAVGPSIGRCCYEVDAEVAQAFLGLRGLVSGRFVFPQKQGKYHLDLWECNTQILMQAGVPREQITVGNLCTQCHSDLLFSHRATKGKRGGLAAFLSLTEE